MVPADGGYDPGGVTGFSHERLAAAFDRVRDPDDWRGPIRAEIPASMRPVVERAIIWFTATAPAFAPTHRPDVLLVMAPGYLRGPWGRADRQPEAAAAEWRRLRRPSAPNNP